MNCNTCGFPLPQEATICPKCGSVTSAYSYDAAHQYDPTVISSQQRPPTNYGGNPQIPSAPPPPQQYGSGSYDMSAQPSYSPAQAPYTPFPAQPAPKKRGNKVLLIVGSILVAVILLCGGTVYLVSGLARLGSSQLQHDATATAQSVPPTTQAITPVTNSSQNPYSPKTGTLIMNDPMQDNSKGYKWDEATMNGKNNSGTDTCGFTNGAYHATTQQKGALICDPEATTVTTLSNLAYEANITIVKGNEAGLVVRVDQAKGTGYLFDITTDGRYVIDSMNFNATDTTKTYQELKSGSNGAIKQGLNQTNLLAIVANGNTISVYINGQFVDSVQDSSLASGQIGIYGYGDNGTDVVAKDARVWQI